MKATIKTISLLVTAILLIATPGCKKDKNALSKCQITKRQNGTDTAYATYDAQGRVNTFGNFQLTYNGLTATMTGHLSDTSDHVSADISLDAQQKMTYMKWVRTSGTDIYTYTFTFEHDADGHIVKCLGTFQESGQASILRSKDSLIWSNGNLVAKYSFLADNYDPYSLYNHIAVQYTTDENKMGYHAFGYAEEPIGIISGWYPVYHLFGKAPSRMPLLTKYYNSAGDLFAQYSYACQLNTNGYITEENIVRSISYPGTVTRKFEYNCN